MSNTTLSPVSTEVIREVANAIEQLRYGSVEITIHDGRVTQIERREKIRFSQPGDTTSQRTKPTAIAAA